MVLETVAQKHQFVSSLELFILFMSFLVNFIAV